MENNTQEDEFSGPLVSLQQLCWLYRQYWRLSSQKDGEINGPYSISDTWPALPPTIDSAFQDLLTKKLYVFSGTTEKPLCSWPQPLAAPPVQAHWLTFASQAAVSGCTRG